MKTYLVTYEDSSLRKAEEIKASRFYLENGWFQFADDHLGATVLIIREIHVDRIDLLTN